MTSAIIKKLFSWTVALFHYCIFLLLSLYNPQNILKNTVYMTLICSFNSSLLIADLVASVFKLLKYCSHVSSFIILTQAGFLHYPVEETHISRDLIF